MHDASTMDRERATGRVRLPELDALRGLAVLAVLGYHGFHYAVPPGVAAYGLGPLLAVTRAGWVGVPLFFALSGFLITGVLLDARERPDYYSAFYRRRARRILPAYLTLLALLALTEAAAGGFLVASLFFVANLAPLLGLPLVYAPLWSLAVEEQFYLAWPLAVRRLSTRAVTRLCGAVLVLSPIGRWLAFREGALDAIYYFTWHTLDGLAAGALLAILLRRRSASVARIRRAARAVLVAGAVLAIAALAAGWLTTRGIATTVWDGTVRATLVAVLAAAGVALAVSAPPDVARSLLRHRTLPFLGRVSYGLYLVQVLGFRLFDRWVLPPEGAGAGFLLARFVTVASSCIAVAAISRATLEAWFLDRPPTAAPSPAPALVPAPVPVPVLVRLAERRAAPRVRR